MNTTKSMNTVKFPIVVIPKSNPYRIPASLPMVRNLYNWLMESEVKTHTTVALATLFTTASAITSRKYYSETDCSSSLYMVVVGKTGIGKNMLITAPTRILQLLDLESKIIASKVSSEGAIDTIFASQNAFTQVVDEFGDQLGNMLMNKGGLSSVKSKMKAMYGLTNSVYEPIRYSSGGGRFKVSQDWKVYRPCYGITGATTREQLLTNLNDSMLHDGFLNRFIILDGCDIKPEFPLVKSGEMPTILEDHIKSIIVDDLDMFEPDKHKHVFVYDEVEKKFFKQERGTDFSRMLTREAKLELARTESELKITIPFSAKAKEYIEFVGDSDKYGTDIYNFCKDDSDDIKRAISARWAENTIRLSLALSAFEKHDEIELMTIVWVYNLIKNASINFLHTYETEANTTKIETQKTKAIRWFSGKGKDQEFTLSELARNSRPFSSVSSKERNALLNELLDSGFIKKEIRDNSQYYSMV